MKSIDVLFNNRTVGKIALKDDVYYFQYSKEWLKNGFSISPFSLPLEEKLFVANTKLHNGFFGVFLDSLPDSWGELLYRRFIAVHELKEENMITRLSFVGKNGMGALEYYPTKDIDLMDEKFDIDLLQEDANKILNEKECENIDTLFKLAGSSGGTRPKVLIQLDGKSYIVKLHSRYDMKNAGQMEYDYAMACKECGINMPPFRLIVGKNGRKYFVIQRFDRECNKKKHMISVAALLEVDYNAPCLDYKDLFKLTKILTNNNKDDVLDLFRRMCFNVFAHNLDDHAKNFSFLFDEENKTYRLSPSYDMTYSNTYYMEHTSSVNGKRKNIVENDLFEVGKQAGLKKEEMQEIIENIKTIVEKRLKKYIKQS